MAKRDIAQDVTDSIIEAMEAGTPPWRQPFTGSTTPPAFPLRSNGKAYRGVNVLMLWIATMRGGYTSAHWFTYRQAQAAGGQVRKGEKSAPVVKYGTVTREDDEGEEYTVKYLRQYRVFNADQIDGLPAEFYRAPEPARDLGTQADPELDGFFFGIGADIITTDKPKACYYPGRDQIHMPPIRTFHGAHDYYCTLAHELTHWTGHASRLDRLKGGSKADYAFEELVAELGSCMVYAQLGLVPQIDQSAAYIEGWLRALKDDKRFIFKAAAEAQNAVDLLLENAGIESAADREAA